MCITWTDVLVLVSQEGAQILYIRLQTEQVVSNKWSLEVDDCWSCKLLLVPQSAASSIFMQCNLHLKEWHPMEKYEQHRPMKSISVLQMSLRQCTSLVYANVEHVKSSWGVKSLQITHNMYLSAVCQHLGTTALFCPRLKASNMSCKTQSLWCFRSASPLMSCYLSDQLHNKSVKYP